MAGNCKLKHSATYYQPRPANVSATIFPSLHKALAVYFSFFKARKEREQVSLQLAEFELKNKNLEELLSTLRDGKGAAKVIEWHKRIDEIRLEDLRLTRNITKLHEQIKFSENLNKSQEHSLVRLEEENVRMAKVSKICRLYRMCNSSNTV